jgi:predicted nucleic acid-binding protein
VILTDTNILLRSLYPADPLYPVADNALAVLRRRRETLCIAPQNLIEVWAVATRPRDGNGLGMATQKTALELKALRDLFRLLPYTPEVHGGMAAYG